jgi:cysteine desulfurase
VSAESVPAPVEAPIYLDWNATTPPHPAVLEAMQAAAEEAWANPSSPHRAGRRARALLELGRERVAGSLGLSPRDVVFTGSGTEANNLALRGAGALVLSRMEHPSVVRVAEELEQCGLTVLWLTPAETGQIDPAEIGVALATLAPELRATTIVALAAANHETGVIQPIVEVAERTHALGARLHVDAAQALGKMDAAAFGGADSYTVVAHKIRGPQGIAALAWSGAPLVKPVLLGGSQERGLRPGTQSGMLVAGFAAALERLDPRRYHALEPRRDRLEQSLAGRALVNGAGAARLPHVSNLSVTGWTGEQLVAALDLEGVCISSGSACSVGTSQPSAVIEAMLGRARAACAVRVSLGESTLDGQVDRAIVAFNRVLARKTSGASGRG